MIITYLSYVALEHKLILSYELILQYAFISSIFIFGN